MPNQDKYNFLYPQNPYRGKVESENLVFHFNLQKFAYKVNYICNLQTGDRVPPEQAYKQLKLLWKELKRSKKELARRKKSFNKERKSKKE